MAYVAFDLDSTLGFFELTNPFAYFWSPDWLENLEQARPNPPLKLSQRLLAKLKRARGKFANGLLERPHLLNLVLRPNVETLIKPLLKLRREGKLRSVIIYSNTSVTYSMELAKMLIERRFRCPGLIQLCADHWHPSRGADHPERLSPFKYTEPAKRLDTLQRLFREATGGTRVPRPDQILFVDDRRPKHDLTAAEPAGLTYVVPEPYRPKLSLDHRKEMLALALSALDSVGLLADQEYLASGICHRKIPYHFTKILEIRGFPDLFREVFQDVMAASSARQEWQPDTADLVRQLTPFLEKAEAAR